MDKENLSSSTFNGQGQTSQPYYRCQVERQTMPNSVQTLCHICCVERTSVRISRDIRALCWLCNGITDVAVLVAHMPLYHTENLQSIPFVLNVSRMGWKSLHQILQYSLVRLCYLNHCNFGLGSNKIFNTACMYYSVN